MDGHKLHSLECFPIFVDGNIIHYTCNSPDDKILKKYGIKSIGKNFGCANPMEVLQIPEKVYLKAGFSEVDNSLILNLNLEKLMRTLR